MITVTHLHKKYGAQQVLNGIDLTLSAGQTVALMGPNGSGKTTFIKCILGMVRPDKGEIKFQDSPIANSWEYRNQIGYMPQAAKFPERIKVKDVFSMLKDIRKDFTGQYDEDLINEFELSNIYNKAVGTLSGGTRQKVSAAIAFLFNPSMLILDEPTTGLDPVSSEILKNKIVKEREKNKLIFITSHIISDIEEVSSHVMYLFDGQLQFIKAIEKLKEETGESNLNKAIINIMVEHQRKETRL